MRFRIHFLLAILLSISTIARAQLSVGSIAPDFTVKDTDGNEYNLYDMLEEGKTVVIDFMTTWCGPCWQFHQEKVFQSIHEVHGPMAADDIYVFMVEADLSTTIEDLQGTGSNTLGNWLEGVDYPVINLETDDLYNNYEVFSYPIMFSICSDKIISARNDWTTTTLASVEELHNNCPLPSTVNNAAVFDILETGLIDCGALEFEPQIIIQNTGLMQLTAATIELSINNNIEETISWDGNLATYETEIVSFPIIALNETSHLTFEIKTSNGSVDEDPSDNILEKEFIASPTVATESLTVEILTDKIPQETYWAIFNSNDEIVAEGGNIAMGFTNASDPDAPVEIPSDGNEYMDRETVYTHDFVLPTNDCYTFSLSDWFGDGINSFAMGHFKIFNENDEEIVFGNGGAFHRLDIPFEYTGGVLSSITENNLSNLQAKIHGNPVTENLMLQLDVKDKETISLTILDGVGKEILRLPNEEYSGHQIKNIKTEYLNSGVYYLKLTSSDIIEVIKFIKN